MIINVLHGQENSNAAEQPSGAFSKSSIMSVEDQNNNHQRNIPDMDPRRANDVYIMLIDLEKTFMLFNTTTGESLLKLTEKIERIAPNCPLDLDNTDFFSNNMYYWVSKYSTEYMQLFSYIENLIRIEE
jgi:hypothetical protein